jgi:hypothetical protein
VEIICTHAFGNCEVGDIRIIPDGAEFSSLYFDKVESPPPPQELPKAKPKAVPKPRTEKAVPNTKKEEG